MGNILKVNIQETIRHLAGLGWPQRRIARELDLHRQTVRRYSDSKCTISTPGSAEGVEGSKCTISTPGSAEEIEGSKCTISTPGKVGRLSQCESLAGIIEKKLGAGLSARRIHQDLVSEKGYGGSYQSVKRYVRRCKASNPGRVWRVEAQPGEEAQVDFGMGAFIVEESGKMRRPWLFRMVLSYSRKGYSEVVWRQNTESFLRALENAFRAFGGAPALINVDNLKAAVLKADWYDPEINPKLAEFCRHYGTTVLPCRPATPQHKGKVERAIAYAQNNALKGRRFSSLGEQNRFLVYWEDNVASKRIHGTTRRQVEACFEEERPHLQPLPASLFPSYQEARRSVHRDSYVEVAKAYYQVPPEYIGREVWVRWDGRCVRIFNQRMEQVQMHVRIEPGKFTHTLGVGGWSTPVRSSCRYWVDRATLVGEACGKWAQALIDVRGPEALRSIMGLCDLTKKHSAASLDKASIKALELGLHRLKDLRHLLQDSSPNQSEQESFAFAQIHPLIRDLKTYDDFLTSQKEQNDNPSSSIIHHDQHPQTTCSQTAVERAA
jgi:transposase